MSGELLVKSITPEENLTINGNLNVSGSVHGNIPGDIIANGSIVSDSVDTKALKTKIYTATGNYAAGLTGGDVWTDFPDLAVTFTLEQETSVMMNYQITMNGYNAYLVTHIEINGIEQKNTRAITGITYHWSNNSQWIGVLPAGLYESKVRYRTGTTSAVNHPDDPTYPDWQTRYLTVMVLGNQ